MNSMALLRRQQRVEATCAWQRTPEIRDFAPCEEAHRELKQLCDAPDLAVREALLRTPSANSPPACHALMQQVADELRKGVGIALLSLPWTDSISDDQHKAIAATMFRCLGPIVDQKISGAPVYAVRDKGRPLGPGVRRSVTRDEQSFHTDGGWLVHAPELVALYCVRQSANGGENQIASLARAHNTLLREAPHLLEALYQPLPWDRQREHAPEERQYAMQSIFTMTAQDGFYGRYYEDYVLKGAKLADKPLSPLTLEALTALEQTIAEDQYKVKLKLEAGQMLLVNNRRVTHARSSFAHEPDLQRRRLMLRLWTRLEGNTSVEGNLVSVQARD